MRGKAAARNAAGIEPAVARVRYRSRQAPAVECPGPPLRPSGCRERLSRRRAGGSASRSASLRPSVPVAPLPPGGPHGPPLAGTAGSPRGVGALGRPRPERTAALLEHPRARNSADAAPRVARCATARVLRCAAVANRPACAIAPARCAPPHPAREPIAALRAAQDCGTAKPEASPTT